MTTATPTSPASYLDAARDAIPGRTALAAALTDLDERLARLRADEQDRAQPVADTADALIADRPADLDNLVDRIVAIDQDNTRRATARDVLTGLRSRLDGKLTALDREHVDTALAHLDRQLTALVDRARPVLAALGDVADVDTAIDRGVAEQWRDAHRLAEDIDALRDAQVDLIAHRYTTGHGAAVADAAVRLWGSITDPGEHSTPGDLTAVWESARARGERPAPPWAGPTLDALRYLCRDDVEPVVPSIGTLTRTRKAVTEPAERGPRASMIVQAEDLRPRTTRVMPYAADVRRRRDRLRAEAADADLEQRQHTATATVRGPMVEDATPMLDPSGGRR